MRMAHQITALIACVIIGAVMALTFISRGASGGSHSAEPHGAQQPRPTQTPVIVLSDSKKNDQEGERINPTPPDPKSKYEVYVPVSLEDAFVELKKMLRKPILPSELFAHVVQLLDATHVAVEYTARIVVRC